MAKGMAMGQNFSFLAAWGMLVLCMAGSGVTAGRQLLEHRHTHNVTFFVHEAINTGADATAYIVAGRGGDTSDLKQGALVVVDNIITETASPKSKQLGKFQGLYVLDGGQKYRAQVTVIIDQPGDLIETTYEVKLLNQIEQQIHSEKRVLPKKLVQITYAIRLIIGSTI